MLLREKWEQEKRSRKEEGQIKEESTEGSVKRSELKVYDKESIFFSAFCYLEQNFSGKVAMPDASAPNAKEMNSFQRLSRRLVQLLRWELPESGLAYDHVDGSVNLDAVSRHLKASASAIAIACSPLVGGKQRLLIFEKKNASHQERRIAAIGGHGF